MTPEERERLAQLEIKVGELQRDLNTLAQDHNGLVRTIARDMVNVYAEFRRLIKRVDNIEIVVHPE